MSETKNKTLSLLIDKFDIKIFDKIDFTKKCATGIAIFTLFTALITFDNYRRNIYNNEKIIKKIKDENKINEMKINDLLESNKKIVEILETQTKMLNDILQNPLLNLSNIEPLTDNSSVLSLSPLLSPKNEEFNNEFTDYKIQSDIIQQKNDIEDNELLNECYENLPCNNSKKITGLNKLFGW
jgi:hypothetical protein